MGTTRYAYRNVAQCGAALSGGFSLKNIYFNSLSGFPGQDLNLLSSGYASAPPGILCM
jgi:hypothetical protein